MTPATTAQANASPHDVSPSPGFVGSSVPLIRDQMMVVASLAAHAAASADTHVRAFQANLSLMQSPIGRTDPHTCYPLGATDKRRDPSIQDSPGGLPMERRDAPGQPDQQAGAGLHEMRPTRFVPDPPRTALPFRCPRGGCVPRVDPRTDPTGRRPGRFLTVVALTQDRREPGAPLPFRVDCAMVRAQRTFLHNRCPGPRSSGDRAPVS
jgi:hypothetical protein